MFVAGVLRMRVLMLSSAVQVCKKEMGTSASKTVQKKVYVHINGQEKTIEFLSNCESKDLKDLLASAAGLGRFDAITLTTGEGYLLPINSDLPCNSVSTSYKLNLVKKRAGDEMGDILHSLTEEFRKTITDHFSARLAALERKFEIGDGENGEEIETADINEIEATVQRMLSAQYQPAALDPVTADALRKPTFNMWSCSAKDIVCYMEYMYRDLGLLNEEEMNVDPVTLHKWLLVVEDNYCEENPFHNFRHCFSVTQMMYGMIHLCGLNNVFSKPEQMILLTSAVCHDIDHPGLSNSYQVNARTELAMRYNDISPLENHHCAKAFELLEKPEINIFKNVSPGEFRKIRAGIVELILATDMSKDADISKKLTQAVEQGIDYVNNAEHRTLLKKMLIKCCDISNEVRPREVSDAWVDCLLEEYFKQSDREKKEGLPVLGFMDREKVTKAAAQVNFLNYILIPHFELMAKIFPGIEDLVVAPLRSSLEYYESLNTAEARENGDKAKTKEAV